MFVIANLLALLELLFLPNSVFLSHKFSELSLLVRLTPSGVIFFNLRFVAGCQCAVQQTGTKFSRALTEKGTSGVGSRLKLIARPQTA